MKVYLERTNESKEMKFKGSVNALLKKLGLNPNVYLISKNGELVTLDDMVTDKDEVKVMSVVSGG